MGGSASLEVGFEEADSGPDFGMVAEGFISSDFVSREVSGPKTWIYG